MWTQDVWLTLIHSLKGTRPEEDKVRDEIFPDQMHEVIQNDWGNLRDPRALRRGVPLMPYVFASSSRCIAERPDSTASACAKKCSCERSGNFSGEYSTILVGAG